MGVSWRTIRTFFASTRQNVGGWQTTHQRKIERYCWKSLTLGSPAPDRQKEKCKPEPKAISPAPLRHLYGVTERHLIGEVAIDFTTRPWCHLRSHGLKACWSGLGTTEESSACVTIASTTSGRDLPRLATG